MSCLTFVQSDNDIWLASDSALSSEINGEWKRIRSDYSKMFTYDNKVYFVSGDISASNILKELILKGIDIEKVIEQARSNKYMVEIVCSFILNGKAITENYSFLNDFDKKVITCNGISVYSVGINTAKATDCLAFYFDKFVDSPINYFQFVYNFICEERIGGPIDIYHISNNRIEKSMVNIVDPFYSNKNTGLIVGDVLVGKIVAGNNLQISNANNNFVLDENGAVLTNASFSLITENQKTQIVLNPQEGIKIQSRTSVGNPWRDKFYVDNSGNAVFSGKLTAYEGTIGGWDIDSEGLSDDRGNYINSNGNIKLGKLTIKGSIAKFEGKIYAENLDDLGIMTEKIAPSAITNSKVANQTLSWDKVDNLFANNIASSLTANSAFIKNLVATNAFVTNATVANLRNAIGGATKVLINSNGVESVSVLGDKGYFGLIGGAYRHSVSIDGYEVKMAPGTWVKGYGTGNAPWKLDTDGGEISTSGLYCGAIGYPGTRGSAIDLTSSNNVQVNENLTILGDFKFGGHWLDYSAIIEAKDGTRWQLIGIEV